eukprot:Phypoly_transcript_14572.p1 GENE.Phypoly_transcript_14572~~Phypoly_transcript_14572.p1  ORF type:complete len:310 (+),score=44.46 Phypoly_transcript_14572:42-971(+)
MKKGNTNITLWLVGVIAMLLLVQADYLTSVSSGNTNLLVWVTENGTVTNIGEIPYVDNHDTIVAQYYFLDSMYYALHDFKTLFSYHVLTRTNTTLDLQLSQGAVLVTVCVSQQFGTLYAVQQTGSSACLVEIDIDSGIVTPASSPVTIVPTTIIQQCIVDDAFSRVVWTYSSVNSSSQTTCYIATTDLLPQRDGQTNILYNETVPQMWLFFNWNSETFYATSTTSQETQISILSIAIDAIKKITLIPKIANLTAAQGTLNTASSIISLFDGGLIEQINIANTSWSQTNLVWGSLDQFSVNSVSAVWVPN